MSALETRISRIESQLKFYRGITLLLLIAVAALLGLGAGQTPPDVIRAKRFEMVNDAGIPLVAMRPTSLGGAIGVFTTKGAVAGVLTTDESGGGLLNILSGQGRNGVLVLGSNADTTGGAVTVYNSEEREVITLRPSRLGHGVVGAWDGYGKGSTLQPPAAKLR
jgi:hypothetical protein